MADEDGELSLFVPVEFTLNAATKKCEMCGSKQGSRTFHKTGFLEATCGRTIGYPKIENLGPHMDRKCYSCDYEWCEQISPFGFDDEED